MATTARVFGMMLALAGCTRQPSASGPTPAPTPTPVGDASVPAQPPTVDTAVHAPVGPTAFAPRWQCRITALGHVGRPPPVSVPRLHPHEDPRAICDGVTLTAGGYLARDPVRRDGGLDLTLANVHVQSAADASVSSSEMPVAPGVPEFLVDAPTGPALGQWDGTTLRVASIDPSVSVFTVPLAANPPGCQVPITDALRVTPIASRPMPFPVITGMPPSTADARWTLGRDVHGLCVLRLEGSGPWGNVTVEATPDGVHGSLSLSEGVYPVACAPVP